MMRERELENGTTVWIHLGSNEDNPKNELRKGKIIHQFDHGHTHLYVIEIDTPVDPFYEVRDWWEISLDGKRIHFWNRVRASINNDKGQV